MSLDISCINIIADINTSCNVPKIGDYRQVGVMFPQEDIDQSSIVNDGCSTKFNLKVPSAIRIFDRSFTPFKGSEVTEENKERFKVYNDTVIVPIIDMTPDNAYIYSKLANGSGRWTVILGIQEGTDSEKNHYQVFGMTTGLVVKSKVQDKANQAYLAITMTEENSGLPARFYFDTNKAATEAKLESYLGYQQITGMTIPDGNSTPMRAYVEVDSDKICYAVMPDGRVLTSISGVINAQYTNFGGRVRLVIPKTTTRLSTIGGAGSIASDFYSVFESNLTGAITSSIYVSNVIVPNTVNLYVGGNANLTTFYAPKAQQISLTGCALTAKSIGDFLLSAVANNNLAVSCNAAFTGGTNATAMAISTYLFNDSDVVTLLDWIDSNLPNWTITFN